MLNVHTQKPTDNEATNLPTNQSVTSVQHVVFHNNLLLLCWQHCWVVPSQTHTSKSRRLMNLGTWSSVWVLVKHSSPLDSLRGLLCLCSISVSIQCSCPAPRSSWRWGYCRIQSERFCLCCWPRSLEEEGLRHGREMWNDDPSFTFILCHMENLLWAGTLSHSTPPSPTTNWNTHSVCIWSAWKSDSTNHWSHISGKCCNKSSHYWHIYPDM